MRKVTVDKSIKDILNRSTAEKLIAVEEIWDNIRKEVLSEKPSEEEVRFVKERIEEYEKNPAKGRSWESIKRNYLKNR